VPLPIASRALAALAQQGAVEHQQGIRARHSGYVGPKAGGG
jgi:glutamate dehydrogenase/leucine dehydrogenase